MANSKAAKKKTSKAGLPKAARKQAKNGSAGKKGNGDRTLGKLEKQDQTIRLRFVQRWPEKDIAKKLGVSIRTVRAYIQKNRNERIAEAEKNSKTEARSICEDLKLSFDEKVKFLWNEFADVHGKEKLIGDMMADVQNMLNQVKDPDKITSLARQMAKLVESQQSCLQIGLSILGQVTQTEKAHVEMLRDLGIVGSSFKSDDDGGDMFLVQIKERYAKHTKNPAVGGTVITDGGDDGKPSVKA